MGIAMSAAIAIALAVPLAMSCHGKALVGALLQCTAGLVKWKKGLANPHADAVKYMHEDLLNKFSKAFAKCLPAIAVRSHRQRRQGDKAPPDQVDGMLDAAMYNPFEEQGRYEPDTTCPNPE